MEIQFNVTGARRKELVSAVSEITDSPVVYKGAPTFAYEVGAFTIDKNGTLSFDSMTGSNLLENLLEKLSERGFDFESEDRLTIEVPLEGFTEEALNNLDKLIAGKAALIKKAIGVDALPVERTETTLKFPWFSADATGDGVKAYTHFVSALCEMAKTQHRVSMSAKPVVNEKYEFRCYLLRLGFIGSAYKDERKILLAPLSGNSAFLGGKEADAE